MSTFDGKCLSYDSSKQVVNKEPSATKVVVERMYRSHRERIQKATSVIDDHVEIPDFMKSQNWREMDKERKQRLLEIDNEHFYKRLTKAESQMSAYTAAQIEHVNLVNSMKKHMSRLKETDRKRKSTQIQRENEFMMARLHQIRPSTTQASMAEWYKHHERFKEAR
jgi:Hemingway/CFA97